MPYAFRMSARRVLLVAVKRPPGRIIEGDRASPELFGLTDATSKDCAQAAPTTKARHKNRTAVGRIYFAAVWLSAGHAQFALDAAAGTITDEVGDLPEKLGDVLRLDQKRTGLFRRGRRRVLVSVD